MNKSAIVGMYGVALYFVLRKYYQNGNSGLPVPTVFVAPTYLYSILALTAEFTGGFTIVLAAGLTVALIWQAQGEKSAGGLTGPVGKPKPATGGTPVGPKGPVGTPQAAPSKSSGPISAAR